VAVLQWYQAIITSLPTASPGGFFLPRQELAVATLSPLNTCLARSRRKSYAVDSLIPCKNRHTTATHSSPFNAHTRIVLSSLPDTTADSSGLKDTLSPNSYARHPALPPLDTDSASTDAPSYPCSRYTADHPGLKDTLATQPVCPAIALPRLDTTPHPTDAPS